MRTAPPPPPPAVLTERQLLAAHPTLTLKSIKRAMSAGSFPHPIALPAGGRGWRAADVNQALAARDAPPELRRVPATHVSLAQLIGTPRVSRCEAQRAGDRNLQRQARPGLVTLTETQVRAGARLGSFPAPTIGPGGVEMWLRTDVGAWLRAQSR